MTFIAGAFTAAHGGNTLGQIRDGFTVEWFSHGQLITGDNFAQTPQDTVHQGLEVFLEATLMEFNAVAAQGLMWPFHATFGRGPVIGSLGSDISYSSLVFTAVTGTPADTLENTWTFAQPKLAEGFPMRIIMQPALREVPLRLRIFPDSSNVFFVVA